MWLIVHCNRLLISSLSGTSERGWKTRHCSKRFSCISSSVLSNDLIGRSRIRKRREQEEHRPGTAWPRPAGWHHRWGGPIRTFSSDLVLNSWCFTKRLTFYCLKSVPLYWDYVRVFSSLFLALTLSCWRVRGVALPLLSNSNNESRKHLN